MESLGISYFIKTKSGHHLPLSCLHEPSKETSIESAAVESGVN